MNTVPYIPYDFRIPDEQYATLLSTIMDNGRIERPIQGGETRSLAGLQLRYNMHNGFPLITERDASGIFRGALGELIGFMNGARTLDELTAYGCPRVYWERWVTAEKCADFGLTPGDLGDASYGASWHDFPCRDGTPFNQIAHVVRQMREYPFLRTHRITPWYPPEIIGPLGTRKVVVAPCHGDVLITLFPDTRELVLNHVQRSGDMPVGIPNNIVQYAAMGMMFAQLIDYTFAEYVFTVLNAHIYEVQYPLVETLLTRPAERFPTVLINDESITDIFAFRPGHFDLYDYHPTGPRIIIPTPV